MGCIAKDDAQSEIPTPGTIEIGERVEAMILKGEIKTGAEIFGEEEARNPDQKRLLLTLSLGEGQEEIERSVPWRDPAGPKTALGQLKEMYGSYPKPGMKINLVMGEDGWRLAGLRY